MRVYERTETKRDRAGQKYTTRMIQVVGSVITEAGFAPGDELTARADRGRIVLERAKPGRNGAKEKIGGRAKKGA